jgi:hypothetical protein
MMAFVGLLAISFIGAGPSKEDKNILVDPFVRTIYIGISR